jgi:ketosteroid isomerase-like protein
MSQPDIEFVKRAFEAMSSGLDDALPLIDPEFEMVTTAQYAAEPDTYRGHEGVRRWFAGFDGVMDRVRVEPRRLEDAGDGQVIVEFTLYARGLSSGIEAGQPALAVVTLRRQKLLRIEFYESVDAARSAVGPGSGDGM